MNLAEALKVIQESELPNKSDILGAINSRVQETEAWETRASNLEQNLNAILEITGTTEGTLEKRLETAQSSIKSLREAESSYQSQLAEKDRQITQAMRENKIAEAVRISKVNPKVFNTLMSGIDGEIETKDGKAYIKPNDGEAMELSAYADEHWPDFKPSLFPETQEPDQGKTPLTPIPGGSAKGEPKKPPDVVSAFIAQTYEKALDGILEKTA